MTHYEFKEFFIKLAEYVKIMSSQTVLSIPKIGCNDTISNYI